jgi:endonuclease VIII
MPEGDTIFRTAEVLGGVLEGEEVLAARGRPGGVQLERVVGSRVERVESAGKHLLISFSNGLTLHTHMQMVGEWHRYRTGERWRRGASRAVAVVQVGRGVAVCFDAPTVELMETRALRIHRGLRRLGPDLIGEDFGDDEALERLRIPALSGDAVGEALLDQRVVAGIGNVFRSEICFIDRVDPFAPVGSLPDETLRRLLHTARRLLQANRRGRARTTMPDLLGGEPRGGPTPAGGRLWVYGRAGRPCRRCGSPIRTLVHGTTLRRRVFWCPGCQPASTVREALAPARS